MSPRMCVCVCVRMCVCVCVSDGEGHGTRQGLEGKQVTLLALRLSLVEWVGSVNRFCFGLMLTHVEKIY